MKKNDNYKNIFLILFIFLCILSVIYIPKLLKSNNDGYRMGIKEYIKKDKYKVNEYVPIMINDEQMSRKYLNNFISIIIDDIDYSYKLVDKDYRDEKFDDLDNYKNYIYGLKISMTDTVDKYATYELNGYKYYDIYDKDGHRFIFKTKGVMQYKVLFDSDTKNGDE